MTEDLSACMSVIRLLTLQYQLLKSSAVRIVNLTQDEATAVVKSSTKYSEVKLVWHFIFRIKPNLNSFHRLLSRLKKKSRAFKFLSVFKENIIV